MSRNQKNPKKCNYGTGNEQRVQTGQDEKVTTRACASRAKNNTEIFSKCGTFSFIVIGDFIKNWGQEREIVFFWPESFRPLTVIFDKKKLANQKILFPKTQY